jgi:hypothetical protein
MGVSLSSGLWIVVGLLSITAVMMLVLMVMMLVGRRGGANATFLSFVVSVLSHLALGCAWFAWYLYSELHPATVAAEVPEPIPHDVVELREVLDEADQAVDSDRSGNTSLDATREAPETPSIARYQSPLEESEPPVAERVAGETPRSVVVVPDILARPETPLAVPEPIQAGETGPLTESRIPLEVEAPERSARPEIVIPETPLDRTIPTLAQQDSIVERSAESGASKRISLDPVPQLAAPDLPQEPDAILELAEDTDHLAFRQGPTPSIQESPELGTEARTEREQGRVGDSQIPQLDRTVLAEPLGISGGSLERQRPNFAPSVPQPRADGLEVTPSLPDVPLPRIGSTLPSIPQTDFDLPTRRPGQLPDTYRLRSLDRRSEMAERFGGTRESERAVENSLAWLAKQQTAAGSWEASRFGAGRGPHADVAELNLSDEQKKVRRESGIQADTGVTALALLSFLAAGYTNEEGQYADHVNRSINWLIDTQREDGYLGGAATYFAANYCHGMATYALAEALGMQSDSRAAPRLRGAVQRAVNYTLGIQLSSDGGWRYNRNSSEGDMSIFGWQLMALKSAEIAGIRIPEQASERMIKFLQARSLGADRGLAAYRVGEPHTPAMTAEALFCKQILGIRRTNRQSIQAAEYLLKQPPKLSEWNLYYWYYGTLAMYQYGGDEWETWNRAMRKVLTESQRTQGDLAGSWDPVGPWGPYGGRIYSTAMATLCLEVYYRFLPLYEHGGRFDE